MGTSSSFGGAGGGTPLLPTWADLPTPTKPQRNGEGEPSDAGESGDGVVKPPAGPNIPPPQPNTLLPRPSVPLPPQHNRFRGARGHFTRFVSSGGTDRRAFGRAVRDHVRTVSGGSKTAARRMTASRQAATGLLSVLRDIRERGVAEALSVLSLDGLIGRSPKEVLLALTNIICKAGGPIDEAIARKAFVETILEHEMEDNLNALTDEQIESVVIEFVGRSITKRVIEDIGQQIDTSSFTPEQAEYLTEYLDGFVLGAVKDRLGKDLQHSRNINKSILDGEMLKIYETAFSIIDAEATALLS